MAYQLQQGVAIIQGHIHIILLLQREESTEVCEINVSVKKETTLLTVCIGVYDSKEHLTRVEAGCLKLQINFTQLSILNRCNDNHLLFQITTILFQFFHGKS